MSIMTLYVFIHLYIFITHNKRILIHRANGRSLIYNVNNTGHRMLPWGTPFSTARELDDLVPNGTTCGLFDK